MRLLSHPDGAPVVRRQSPAARAAIVILGVAAATPAAASGWQHAIAVTGSPRYAAGFKHFAYVNPNAPKGCTWRRSPDQTSFTTLNPFTIMGRPAIPIHRYLYASLLAASADEVLSAYSWAADGVRFGPGDAWVEFRIRETARWHDGRPIRAADVAFTARILGKHGRPFYRYLMPRLRVEIVSARVVRVILPARRARQAALRFGTMPILPAHWWRDRTFKSLLLEPPLGSGAYRVAAVEPGRRLVLERVKKHWARDLPVSRGANNFDRLEYTYVRDTTARFEMFLRGTIDHFVDRSAGHWIRGYDVPAVKDGRIRKIEQRNWFPVGANGFFFNLRRTQFADRRVREALTLMFDFEWANRVLFHGAYERTWSYFKNTRLAALGPPSAAEREILSAYRSELPPEALVRAFRPPVSDGSGRDRKALNRALKLLSAAGWRLRGGVMRNARTGQPLRFVVLARSPRQQKVLGHWFKALERLGIQARLKVVDSSLYAKKLRERDFDVTQRFSIPSRWPGNNQKIAWRSDGGGRGREDNRIGLKSPLVDMLVDKLAATDDYKEVLLYGRLLDRTLQWKLLAVPGFLAPSRRVAHWNKFGRPPEQPKYGFGFDYWWCKAAETPRASVRPPRAR